MILIFSSFEKRLNNVLGFIYNHRNEGCRDISSFCKEENYYLKDIRDICKIAYVKLMTKTEMLQECEVKLYTLTSEFQFSVE